MTADNLPLAASVLLLRPGQLPGVPFEVYMLRRLATARFAPGAYIFPGGILEADDRSTSWALFDERAAPGLARHYQRMCGGGHFQPDEVETAAALLVCGTRELFEESGVLLARPRTGSAPSYTTAELDASRRLLLNGSLDFEELLAARELRLDPDELVYFSHWITPSALKLRYDTHFFLAVLPTGVEATHFAGEMDAGLWISPQEALQRHADGEFPMVPVQTSHLERLAAFDTLEALLDFGSTKQVRAVLAELVDRSVHIPEEVRQCW